MPYSSTYMDHFSNPRGVGEIEDPDGIGEVKHEGGGCFDTVRLTLKIEGGRIADAKFRARACSGTIAACSALCDILPGKPLGEAAELTPESLTGYLGGIPETKRHSVELAVRALRAALDEAGDDGASKR